MAPKNMTNLVCFLAAAHWARRCTERRVAWPWRRRQCFFCVVSYWQNVKICERLLEMPSFQCIGGGSVPPPPSWQTLGRVMHRKARRLALAEGLMQFFVSYRVGKMLKSVNVCLKCPVFNALGASLGGGLNAFFCLVSGLECVGKCVAWVK